MTDGSSPKCAARSVAMALLIAAGLPATADPVAVKTTILGPFTGHDAKLHPDNLAPHRAAYYGTDLGWSYAHGGKLHFLFGDTAASEQGATIEASSQGLHDDAFGTIDLAEWPDPARITPANIPPIRLGQNPGTTEVSAIDVGRAMESFKTPIGGFSNGRREFGIFYFSKPLGCRADADCPSGLSCDLGLGFAGEPYDDDKGLTIACVDGSPGCNAQTMKPAEAAEAGGSGFCADRTSSAWADTDVGRVSGVAVTNLVGVRSAADPRRYGDIREWPTNKFANAASRTVRDFVPARGAGRAKQDYRPAEGGGGNARVFLWGRPGFIGVKARGRSLGLYFAYADMPGDAGLEWKLRYYSGVDADGVPQFSSHERDAVAVDLDSTQAGSQPVEPHDIVDHMSVVWVEELGKWVMFYGGGIVALPTETLPGCGVLEFFARSECTDVDLGNGAIRMRTADDPWGPWSPPQDVLVGGDRRKSPPEQQFGPGGILRHPDCRQETCAGSTDWEGVNPREYGFLYGVNIIEQWTRPAGDGVDLIWNLSTWNPYRVVLARTRIRSEPTPKATEALGPFAGYRAPVHPDNTKPERIAYYGTDLGWSYAHGGKIHFIFGDTHANEKGEPNAPLHDDSFGTIDLADWPDPSKISATHLPRLRIGAVPGTSKFAVIDPGHPMEGFKTPVGAFSNGKREFGLFLTAKPLACRTDADCIHGLSCDTGLGVFGERPSRREGLTLPCNDGMEGCAADPYFGGDDKPVTGSGLCVDRTSTIWTETDFGRAGAYAINHLVGLRSETDPAIYTDIREWLTNKFTNVAVRAAGDRVYLWGRPGFIGLNAQGATLGLYFAYVDMPQGPGFSWDVHYFAGLDADGAPRYSRNERNAVPLDLDSTQEGVQAQEIHDIVNHVSIVRIERLKKWVMFYGGGISKFPLPGLFPRCGVLQVFARGDCGNVAIGNGAIRMRTADEPWGPWSPPRDVLVGGDADARPVADQYGPGGLLHHPACAGENCQQPSAQLPPGEYGWLYGANIIEEWTLPAGEGVDVIWIASTWNPYHVFLLRTHIDP